MMETYCGHTFHDSCMMKWIDMQTSQTCPMCRRDLISQILRSNLLKLESIAEYNLKDCQKFDEIVYSIRRHDETKGCTTVLMRKGQPLNQLVKDVENFGLTADTLLSITIPLVDDADEAIFWALPHEPCDWIKLQVLDGRKGRIELVLG